MCDSSKAKEIAFTDKQIETASVLNYFLSIVLRSAMPSTKTLDECEVACHTIKFLRKYNCEGPLRFLKTGFTSDLIRKEIPPLYVFMMAAAKEDSAWAKMAFEHRYPVPKKAPNEAKFVDLSHLSLSPGTGDLDGVWPLELWNRIENPFAWAAAAAWTRVWGGNKTTSKKSCAKCGQTSPDTASEKIEGIFALSLSSATGKRS